MDNNRRKLHITLPAEQIALLKRAAFWESKRLSFLVEEAVDGLLAGRRRNAARTLGEKREWLVKPAGEDYPPIPGAKE